MKLSRAGWNNVLIFSIMAYILLINTTHNSLFGDDENDSGELTLLPEASVILALQVNQSLVIERIGQSWRTRPVKSASSQALSAMMMAWQDSKGLTLAEPPQVSSTNATVVTLTLAGEEQPLVLMFYVDSDQVLVHNKRHQRWLSIAPEIYRQLFPKELNNA